MTYDEVPHDGTRAPNRAPCPIVGLGASAGGLEAFQGFISALPPSPGMAFVLIQHLDPTRKSMLGDLLGHCTAMPVSQVLADTPVQPDHVYLIPPNKTLVIEGGVLKLNNPAEPRGQRSPIDVFFRSLAQDQGENAACIILSGTGSDGTQGLRAIKERGGLTISQTEGSAKYDSMPHNAAASGMGDYVLSVEEMPAVLIDYFHHLGNVDASKAGEDDQTTANGDLLIKICAILRTRTGHDFSRYKKNTLFRRIQRRMQVLHLNTLPDYVEALRSNPDESNLLFRDLLINVTQFFRDPEAFEVLARQVIPRIVDGRGPNDHIRLWIPGCSTGEEAYTLAMLVCERMKASGTLAKAQIFASDIDEEALEIARLGRYPDTIANDVGAERLERFFVPIDHGYQVAKDIREMCIFSLHSVIKDPPFSRLDLISCRNLLIYLGAPLQAKLIPIFHYALKPEGVLFLGPSENVTQNGRLFTPIDAANRIFSRCDVPTSPDLQFPLSGPHDPPLQRQMSAERAEDERQKNESQDRLGEQLVIDQYAPAHAIVTEGGDIVQVSVRTGKYLELPSGTPKLNVIDMARPGLRNDLRAALHRATREKRRVVHANLEFGVNGGHQRLDLVVHPIGGSARYLVVFQDLGALRPESTDDDVRADEVAAGEDARVRDLESELRLSRERLRTAIEELETSNEELKSSNEEMMSMNEELQSANEELETSKEELQSINEELETVNTELRHKLAELSHANSDLQNLFESTQIATIFLGNDLRIRNFTPATQAIFRLIDGDRGRPLTDLASRFPLQELNAEAGNVARTLVPMEREISYGGDGPDLLMRIMPYRTVNNAIDGVVLTFIDVTRLKRAERRVAESEARYRAVLQGAHDAALVFVLEDGPRENAMDLGPVREANAAARALLGYGDEEFGKLSLRDIVVADDESDTSAWADKLRHEGAVVAERLYRAKSGAQIPVEESATLVQVRDQELVVVLARDIRDRREIERQQRFLMRELQHRVKNTLATVAAVVDQTGRRTNDFATFKILLGGRLRALANAHARLSESNWGGISFRALADDELLAYAGNGDLNERSRIEIIGEDIRLAPQAALSLTLALHELATNAAKYGALSTADGTVALSWRHEGDMLEISWTERGGPEITAAPGSGFGRFLLERGIVHDLDGKVDLRFDPAGVCCRISLPWRQVIAARGDDAHSAD
ncbi:MAG: PAS domain-containing protein [Alphaproteobacteria bacterium]|nr:PAS domain-containing protein [Alphaproteobacteria bacterium]